MRENMRHGLIAMVLLGLAAVPTRGQQATESDISPWARARQEVESVLAEVDSLTDKLGAVKVRARAANLLWPSDPDRARRMFTELWQWIEVQKDEALDREAARTAVLQNVFPRSPRMAKELLAKASTTHKSEEAPFAVQLRGRDPHLRRLHRLAAGMLDRDPSLAASLLEQSLSVSVSPPAFQLLLRLREKDPSLADYLVMRTLEALQARPTVIALSGVHVLSDYVFPTRQMAGRANPPDETLRGQYFSAAYTILQRSLQESEAVLQRKQRYTAADLRLRSLYQGPVAAILAALAPRYAPELVGELSALAARLAKEVPSPLARLERLRLLRLRRALGQESEPAEPEDLDDAVGLAIERGELDKARKLIGRIEDEVKRKSLAQAIAHVEFRSHLSGSNLAQALLVARRIEDLNMRATMYAEVARAAQRKGEVEFARLILAEARLALANAKPNGLHVRALLRLAATASSISGSEAIALLQEAVTALNGLALLSREEASTSASPRTFMRRLNDPRRLIDEPELDRAFASLGRIDLDEALLTASQIEDPVMRLFARLAASETWLEQPESSATDFDTGFQHSAPMRSWSRRDRSNSIGQSFQGSWGAVSLRCGVPGCSSAPL